MIVGLFELRQCRASVQCAECTCLHCNQLIMIRSITGNGPSVLVLSARVHHFVGLNSVQVLYIPVVVLPSDG